MLFPREGLTRAVADDQTLCESTRLTPRAGLRERTAATVDGVTEFRAWVRGGSIL